MNETDECDDVLHNLLHANVDHIHASTDLADRVEVGARRRRTARRSVTGVVALVAAGAVAGVLTAIHPGSVPTAAAQLPRCAQQLNTYLRAERRPKPNQGLGNAKPLVPGTPVGAVVCRYAGLNELRPEGDLAGSATITDKAQISRLQSAVNKSQIFTGAMYCPFGPSDEAVMFFTYGRGTANLEVFYDRWCGMLHTADASYLVRGDLYQIVTNWTGIWQHPATPSAR